jgi:hypothetical protein
MFAQAQEYRFPSSHSLDKMLIKHFLPLYYQGPRFLTPPLYPLNLLPNQLLAIRFLPVLPVLCLNLRLPTSIPRLSLRLPASILPLRLRPQLQESDLCRQVASIWSLWQWCWEHGFILRRKCVRILSDDLIQVMNWHLYKYALVLALYPIKWT